MTSVHHQDHNHRKTKTVVRGNTDEPQQQQKKTKPKPKPDTEKKDTRVEPTTHTHHRIHLLQTTPNKRDSLSSS